MKNSSLLATTIIMGVLAVGAFLMAYAKGKHMEGLSAAKAITIQILPLLALALLLAGLLQVLVPAEMVSRWIGQESGLKGILIGSLAGALLPGGPYVTLPLVVGLAKAGAAVPVLVAMITGWSLIAVMRLPMELGILGPKLTLIRIASTFIFAPLSGLMARGIMKIFKIG